VSHRTDRTLSLPRKRPPGMLRLCRLGSGLRSAEASQRLPEARQIDMLAATLACGQNRRLFPYHVVTIKLSALLTAEHRQFNIALVLRRVRVANARGAFKSNGDEISSSSMSILLHLIAIWILLDALVVALLERASPTRLSFQTRMLPPVHDALNPAASASRPTPTAGPQRRSSRRTKSR
jgi:hypothetical protein